MSQDDAITNSDRPPAVSKGDEIKAQIGRVLVGQQDVVHQVLVCLLAGGHVLIEGVPGLGKTLLVKSLAQTIQADSSRIQFTPDLMPSDVTGHAVFNMKEEQFEVRKGPVFTNLLLADEINRAPAKTQSALLEVMQEKQVTIEGDSYAVGEPFMVLATQNPVEQDGTYPLPEAELDRFMMKVLIDYPDLSAELKLVTQQTAQINASLDVSAIRPVTDGAGVLQLRQAAATLMVDDQVLKYAVELVRCSRDFVGISQGASPRASIALVAASRVNAMLLGRDFVTPDDVKEMLIPILRHRVTLSPDREIEGQSPDDVLQEMVGSVEAPRL